MSIIQTLNGWGITTPHSTECFTPSFQEELKHLNGIMRGYGSAYGDAAIGLNQTCISKRLKRFISCDVESGLVEVESGCSLQDIHDEMRLYGWGIPVFPGTRNVSAGGAFAANIHGKNHLKAGSFAAHVKRISLITGTGEQLSCCTHENSELFWAAAGGMGLTGIITSLTIQLTPISHEHYDIHRQTVSSISQTLDWLDNTQDEFDERVIWLDVLNGTSPQFIGIAEGAIPSNQPDNKKQTSSAHITIPPQRFSWLKRWNMKRYNQWRYRKLKDNHSETLSHNAWHYPLDAIGNWNHLYGPKGFYQYQCLIPDASSREDILSALFRCIDIYKLPVYLCVIKAHGPADPSYLGFCDKGISVALDMPHHANIHECANALDEIVLEAKGRIYLAKDALAKPETIEKMYGEALIKWRKIAKQYDPDNRWHSAMNARLNLRGNQ